MSVHLDGVDITILKTIGLGGTTLSGEALAERLSSLDEAELIDALKCLVQIGYIECDGGSLHSAEDVKKASFHVNSGYSKELREAIHPNTHKPQKRSRRVRRE